MKNSKEPRCGAVALYWNVRGPVFGFGVAGQAARAWSTALYLSVPALHSFPSGMIWRLLPLASRMWISFQSYGGWVPPIATAAWHGAVCGCSGFSRKHSYTRLTGFCIEPCALAWWVTASTAAPTVSAPIAAAKDPLRHRFMRPPAESGNVPKYFGRYREHGRLSMQTGSVRSWRDRAGARPR